MKRETEELSRKQKIEAMRNQSATVLALAFGLVVFAFVCAGFGLVAVTQKTGGFNLDNLAALGSYFQGTVASVFALCGLLVLYASWLAQRHQLLQQEEQMEDQGKQFQSEQDAMRRHNMLSVRPHLVLYKHTHWDDNGATGTVDLCNHGIGPARIKNVCLLLDDKPFVAAKGNQIEELMHAQLAAQITDYHVNWCALPECDHSIIVGQRYRMLEIYLPGVKKVDEKRLGPIFQRSDLVIEYESFYGEPFILDTRQTPSQTSKPPM